MPLNARLPPPCTLRSVAALSETDRFGWAAYVCALDGAPLEPIGDAPGVLQCPSCGRRTDASGDGVLGDGFDVRHRQWGSRGDAHAWSAMRELVGAVPTPHERDAVRAAYLDVLRRVADVDLDRSEDVAVYRAGLDRGGVSGGRLDLIWWRTKGIPLLVDRAHDRRPAGRPAEAAATSTSAPGPRCVPNLSLGAALVVFVVLGISATTIGGGTYVLYERAVGTRVEATVLRCAVTGGIVRGAANYREACVAEWTIDGTTVVGALSGGSGGWRPGDTVDATARGDRAYSRALGLPMFVIALGVALLTLFGYLALARRRRVRAAMMRARGPGYERRDAVRARRPSRARGRSQPAFRGAPGTHPVESPATQAGSGPRG